MAFKRSFAVLFLLTASVLASPYSSSSSKNSSSSSKKSGEDSCSKDEFWYSTKSCCLPNGGVPKPPSPPPGKSCPKSTHYWRTELGCCVPTTKPPSSPSPPPQCPEKEWDWNPSTQCCEPGRGTPTTSTHKPSQTPKSGGYSPPKSGGYSPPKSGGYTPPPNGKGGHNYKKRSATPLCPRSFEACPISGLTGSEYECLDTTAELSSCGGCAATGKGQDCTTIKGAWNVGCESGSCAVYTCELGYKVAADGKSCIDI